MNAKTSAETADLEYQYSEDQLTEESGLEPTVEHELPVAKPNARFSRKKIIVGIVICAMVGAVFQFLSSRDKAADGAAEVEQAAKAMQHEKAATAVKPAAKPSKAVESIAAPVPAVVKEEEKPAVSRPEAKTLAEQFNKIAPPPVVETKNEPQIKELQLELSGVNQSVGGLNKTIESLAAQVQSLSNQVEQLNKEQKTAAAAAASAAKSERTQYYLKAIITGRAWIESATGDLTTVKVGDEISGYGTVTMIDPEDAQVLTSDGTVIKHAPNDS